MEQTAITDHAKPSASHPAPGQVRARASERFHLKQGFVAFSATNFCEIRDISKNGIGLQYLAHQDSPCDEMSEISLLSNIEGFLLGQINCRIAYVNDTTPAGQYCQTVIRKIGLQFMNLSTDQQEQLDDLLDRFSMEQDAIH
ncbi:MAG: PilZ domain-containing protein [Thermodesulfobacteriota bacterium]